MRGVIEVVHIDSRDHGEGSKRKLKPPFARHPSQIPRQYMLALVPRVTKYLRVAGGSNTRTHLNLGPSRARRPSPPPRHRMPLPIRRAAATTPVCLPSRRS